jgi:hypothetical protein
VHSEIKSGKDASRGFISSSFCTLLALGMLSIHRYPACIERPHDFICATGTLLLSEIPLSEKRVPEFAFKRFEAVGRALGVGRTSSWRKLWYVRSKDWMGLGKAV